MSQKIETEPQFSNKTDKRHASFLIPFFEEMNILFTGKWCVLHSYETLPNYSESDVDMAFAGSSLRDLEVLITKVAADTGWQLFQKLWYDVQWCCYYVLREKESGTFLAIDFLTDNYGIGSYGFQTNVLTHNCYIIDNLIPVPNHETALLYKLVKRIEKVRLLDDDKDYLRRHFDKSNQERIAHFLNKQYGARGEHLLMAFISDKDVTLSKPAIIRLKQKRKKQNFTLGRKTKFAYWETLRLRHRIYYPSGMQVNIPTMEKNKALAFTEILKAKVDILFRFVELDVDNSKLKRLKGITGSTLIICRQSKFNQKKAVQYQWLYPKHLELDTAQPIDFDDLNFVSDKYLTLILKALSIRISSKLRTNG